MCSFIRDAVQTHILANPTLASLMRSESCRLQNDPDATPETLQLILTEYHPVQNRWLRDPIKVGPFFILGEIRVCKSTYPIRFGVTDDTASTITTVALVVNYWLKYRC